MNIVGKVKSEKGTGIDLDIPFHFSLPPSPSRGFTLIEMLISLAIFGVITGMVLANFRVGSQGDELRISSQLVASAIRRAQTLAVAGQTVAYCLGGNNDKKLCPKGATDCPSGTCTTEVPAGFGIHFSTAAVENRKMILFADIDGNNVYSPSEAIRTDNVSSGPFVIVQTVSPAVSGMLDIVFVPPKPTIVINNNATADGIATVTVNHSSTGQQKIVTINKVSGQVSAQ